MQLTPHFSLVELTRSSKAEQLGIENTPNDVETAELKLTAELLERIRKALGNHPVTVTSGFRNRQLNKAVGGASTSDHALGKTADILIPKAGAPYDVCKRLAPLVDVLGIGQLIYETNGNTEWIHIGRTIPQSKVNRVISIHVNAKTGKRTLAGIQPK